MEIVSSPVLSSKPTSHHQMVSMVAHLQLAVFIPLPGGSHSLFFSTSCSQKQIKANRFSKREQTQSQTKGLSLFPFQPLAFYHFFLQSRIGFFSLDKASKTVTNRKTNLSLHACYQPGMLVLGLYVPMAYR